MAPRKKTLSVTKGWELTRQRVAQAATSVLGTAGHVTSDALVISVELLKLVPDTSLTSAARTLVIIWEALQLVDTNRLACLRLTERCAETLLSVYEEVNDAGRDMEEELTRPIAKLNESFNQVHIFLQKQVQRSFLDRYIRRDEILGQIAECDASLRDAMSMFSLSIQIRILKQIQQSSRAAPQQDNATSALVSTESQGDLDMKKGSSSVLCARDPIPTPDRLSPSSIVPTLQSLQSLQNTSDTLQDMADLRSLMYLALQKNSDVEMMEVLQVGREEMPDAIKMLQQALECVVKKDIVEVGDIWGDGSIGDEIEVSGFGGDSRRSGMGFSVESNGSTGSGWRVDTLDRDLIVTGLDALKRMSKGMDIAETSPVWCTPRYELDWHQRHQGYLEV